ncbi:PREDICTED: pantetheinase-like isoform X1 [Sturnus vulgaris]|uniref:pantetheinase-like isoform X1 n=1 Tax=Sturnus vulgaris TaxID=9172 RepID=UPI00071A5A5F|nr:PREDICTED: pantetheinase-like isoform X1 [Sturnus vulgaris]
MLPSQALLPAVVFALAALQALASNTFLAAVYEHAVILPDATDLPVSPSQALAQMNKNMDVLEGAIKEAARQGAHIIVTPEDGIYGWRFTRESIYPYLEDIPDPVVNWIPCTDPSRFGPAPVQERLSCMARNNSIYVVANIGDKKPCDSSDPSCPRDGRYQYNTDVVFDTQGKLVARYHKYNLFRGETQFNYPKEPEAVTFETPFGKFGIFTCFDILFYEPAVVLVSKMQVDTVLFPTAWMNVLPFLTAIEFHSAWAMGMRVNLLSANTHSTSKAMTGSGLFTPQGPAAYHYDSATEEGRLLLAELSTHPRLSPTYPPAINWSSHATSIKKFPGENDTFSGAVRRDIFTFSELRHKDGNCTVCQGDLCCHLVYQMSNKSEDEVYVLGAFDGLHGSLIKYHWQVIPFLEVSVATGRSPKSICPLLHPGNFSCCQMQLVVAESLVVFFLSVSPQICSLLKCPSTNLSTCGQPVETAQTKFEMFSLSGTFGTSYVFPEVLYSGVQLAPGEFEVLRDGRLKSKHGTSKPLVTATLFGRLYEKDPPHPLRISPEVSP